MKKIINGKVYDTEKARELGTYSGGDGFYSIDERLYQKRTGEFFLHGVGGPATKYAHSVGLNQWSGGEKIIPLDVKAARQWVEEHLDTDAYEEIFGIPDDDGETVTLCANISSSLMAAARLAASKQGVSMTAIVERALGDYLK